jgi:hypothetical protein
MAAVLRTRVRFSWERWRLAGACYLGIRGEGMDLAGETPALPAHNCLIHNNNVLTCKASNP